MYIFFILFSILTFLDSDCENYEDKHTTSNSISHQLSKPHTNDQISLFSEPRRPSLVSNYSKRYVMKHFTPIFSSPRQLLCSRFHLPSLIFLVWEIFLVIMSTMCILQNYEAKIIEYVQMIELIQHAPPLL